MDGCGQMEKLTVLAQVVHQQNLLQILFGCSIQHAVHCAQERGPSLVMETDNNTGRRQRLAVLLPQTPVKWGNKLTLSKRHLHYL